MVIFWSVWLMGLLALLFSPLDIFLDATMAQHMLWQPIIYVFWGYLGAKKLPGDFLPQKSPSNFSLNPYGLSGIIFVTGTVIFWMIPRSLDTTLSSVTMDKIFHLVMLANGFVAQRGLPAIPYLLRAVFGLHFLAMFSGLGLFYLVYQTRACTSYPLEQQKVVGAHLITFGVIAFVAHLWWIITCNNRQNKI